MKYILSPKKFTANSDKRESDTIPTILFDLSPNLIHTYGKCDRRLQLSKRLRLNSFGVFNDHYQRCLEQTDNCPPNDSKQFGRYLDLIPSEDLKAKPLSRLQSRHPIRHISRVRIRPKPTDKVDIKRMEFSSFLRTVCLKNVESLKQSDIELKINETEIYCRQQNSEICSQTLRQTNSETNECKKTLPIDVKSCGNQTNDFPRLVLHKLELCPNCEDPLFNRSRKNTKKRKFHSCLKGRVNNLLCLQMNKFWL